MFGIHPMPPPGYNRANSLNAFNWNPAYEHKTYPEYMFGIYPMMPLPGYDRANSLNVRMPHLVDAFSGISIMTGKGKREKRNLKVKRGIPTDDELAELGWNIANLWKKLGRRLGFFGAMLEMIEQAYAEQPEKGFQMLRLWKEEKGSAATYEALRDALKHKSVQRGDLAKTFCCTDDVSVSIFAGSLRSLSSCETRSVRKRRRRRRRQGKENHKDGDPGWREGELLGAGAFGKVYECIPIWPSMDFEGRRAVKKVKIEPQYTEAKEVKAFRNEIEMLGNLRHERIVSFFGSEEKDGYLHLFMEFMAGGSLSDHIKNHKVLFESESRRYTKQILEGVNFLHAENIIHRDIKGSNVLLDGERNVKLADFGLSKVIQKIGSKTDLVSHCGTPHWMAPELIRGKGYGRKADIWSVGCTVVEMLTGRPPLSHLEPVAAIFEIGSNPTVPTLPEGVSQEANDFIQAALTPDPLERPWSVELLKHSFVVDSTDW